MRKAWWVIPALLLSLLVLTGCDTGNTGISEETAAAATLAQEMEDVVSATGEVRPARWAGLAFPVGGTIKALHVEEGEDVSSGQLLAELDAISLERAFAEAQAALGAAEANLARTKAGPRPEDVAAAAQAVTAAEANVGVAETQIAAAEAGLAQAQTGVVIAQAQEAIAQAGVKVAQAELSRAQAGATQEDLIAAQAALDKARAAVQNAQSDYDRVGRGADTPQSLALEQATLNLTIAQADYDRVASGPRSSDLAPARAGIESAKAQVLLAQAQVTQAESAVGQAEVAVEQARASREAAEAQVAQAQAQLDRAQAGPTIGDVAVAEAAVEQALQAVVSAEAALDQTRLAAPFDGTVGMVYVREDEEVLPGQDVLVLGNLATLRVETTDLDEYDVARVQPGRRADLTFDALPDKVLEGSVVSIAPMASLGQSATTYRVIIEFDEIDPALRWGMTAFVDIRVN